MRLKHTFKTIYTEALKYTSRGDFKKNDNCSYKSALRRNILDEVCSHMPKRKNMSGINHPNYKYTDEQLYKEALKYKTKSEFEEKSPNFYSAACRRKIINKICIHMPIHINGSRHANYKYTNDSIHTIALKYNTRNEFAKTNPSFYRIARERGILEKVCVHMKKSCGISLPEQRLFSLIKERFPKTQKLTAKNASTIANYIKGFEIDIYVSELRKGIEFDGTYWHSLEGLKRSHPTWLEKDLKNYHKIKDEYFRSQGIEILHVKEEDWSKNPDKCLEKCLTFLSEVN